MGMQMFSGRGRNGEYVRLPMAYRASVKWVPKLGDTFPDFKAASTDGPMRFYDWADGQWSFLFSHPGAFTPVCTTEMAGFAAAAEDFAARGVGLMAVSADDVADQQAWRDDIEQIFGVEIGFPSVSDRSGILAEAFGMIHPHQSAACAIRKSFLIDPSLKIRMIFEYPIFVGRSTDEVLRVIDALQISDRTGLAAPADWQPGDDLVAVPGMSDSAGARRFGKRWCRVRDYLNVVSVAPEDHTPKIYARTPAAPVRATAG